MKTVKGFTKLGLVFGMAAALAACGGGPSDAEVRKVIEDQVASELEQVSGIAGVKDSGMEEMVSSMMPKIENISPQGCKSSDNDAYLCTVEVTATMMGQTQTNMQDLRLKKNKSGEWKIIR